MRIKRTVNALKKRRKIFRLSKGYFGNKLAWRDAAANADEYGPDDRGSEKEAFL